jgi:hypothetical protein
VIDTNRLQPGKRYRVVHQEPGHTALESVLTYTLTTNSGDVVFDARPLAPAVWFPRVELVSAVEVDPSTQIKLGGSVSATTRPAQSTGWVPFVARLAPYGRANGDGRTLRITDERGEYAAPQTRLEVAVFVAPGDDELPRRIGVLTRTWIASDGNVTWLCGSGWIDPTEAPRGSAHQTAITLDDVTATTRPDGTLVVTGGRLASVALTHNPAWTGTQLAVGR